MNTIDEANKDSEEDSDDENSSSDDDFAKISKKIKCKFTIRTFEQCKLL